MALAKSSFSGSVLPRADDVAIMPSQTKIVGIRTQLFAAARGHKKVVFQAQPPAAFPVHSRLNGEHHAGAHCPRSCLMGVRRLMRARAHAVRHRMRWLARIASGVNSLSQDTVDIPERRSEERRVGKECRLTC